MVSQQAGWSWSGKWQRVREQLRCNGRHNYIKVSHPSRCGLSGLLHRNFFFLVNLMNTLLATYITWARKAHRISAAGEIRLGMLSITTGIFVPWMPLNPTRHIDILLRYPIKISYYLSTCMVSLRTWKGRTRNGVRRKTNNTSHAY